MDIRSLGKFISLILRHKPETIGIKLDAGGWANVEDLLRGINRSGKKISFADLEIIVYKNDKQRFSFNADKTKIRANQGHSINVDVELEEKIPPAKLFHGTLEKNSASIEREGILKMSRLYVHLSADIETAEKVARRRKGTPLIYEVDAAKMSADGIIFYQSVNGVWLTNHVPAKYLSRLEK